MAPEGGWSAGGFELKPVDCSTSLESFTDALGRIGKPGTEEVPGFSSGQVEPKVKQCLCEAVALHWVERCQFKVAQPRLWVS